MAKLLHKTFIYLDWVEHLCSRKKICLREEDLYTYKIMEDVFSYKITCEQTEYIISIYYYVSLFNI